MSNNRQPRPLLSIASPMKDYKSGGTMRGYAIGPAAAGIRMLQLLQSVKLRRQAAQRAAIGRV